MTMTMAERRQVTREQLMDAALKLFAERGIMAASAVQISAEAGYTRGAFHFNFASKDELALAVLERESKRYLDALEASARRIKADDRGVGASVQDALAVLQAALPGERASLLLRLEARLYAARVPAFRAELLKVEARMRDEVGRIMAATLAALGLELTVSQSRAVNLVFLTYEQESLAALLTDRPMISSETRNSMIEVLTSIVRARRPSHPDPGLLRPDTRG